MSRSPSTVRARQRTARRIPSATSAWTSPSRTRRAASASWCRGSSRPTDEAAESSATSGTKWRAHFAPPRVGEWQWRVSCRTGTDVAIAPDARHGQAVSATRRRHRHVQRRGRRTRWRPTSARAARCDTSASATCASQGTAGRSSREESAVPRRCSATRTSTGRSATPARRHTPPPPVGLIPLPALDAGLHRYAPHVADWRDGDPDVEGRTGQGPRSAGSTTWPRRASTPSTS